MKNKFISFGILLISFLLFTASTTSFVSDLQNLFNNQTKELATQKNKEYQKTKNKPEIRLLSLKNSNDINKIRPTTNQVIIVAALQNKEKMFKFLLVKITKMF